MSWAEDDVVVGPRGPAENILFIFLTVFVGMLYSLSLIHI